MTCEHSPTVRLFAINTVPGADGCPICLAAECAALRTELIAARGDNNRMITECAVLRKDAERYRHIRSNRVARLALQGQFQDTGPESLDAAIDAAMGESRE